MSDTVSGVESYGGFGGHLRFQDLVGGVAGNGSKISSCSHTGRISAKAGDNVHIGGVAGNSNSSALTGCNYLDTCGC